MLAFVPIAPIRLHRADATPPISDLDVLVVALDAALETSPCSKATVVAPTSTPMGLLTCLFVRCEIASRSIMSALPSRIAGEARITTAPIWLAY
jgi:hypothetical protein